jgi:hypothetical protein
MTGDIFDELVKNIVESNKSSAVVARDHGIDLFTSARRYNAAIDIRGEAYCGKDVWAELMEALFIDDPIKTLDQIKKEINLQ